MQLKLNKYDVITTIIVIVIAFTLMFFVLNNNSQSSTKIAKVYYENKVVHTFNLSENKEEKFEINATNGLVKIETKDGRVRVTNETSKHNICSIQGWSDSEVNPIVCLPNNLYIRIEGSNNDEVDGIIK